MRLRIEREPVEQSRAKALRLGLREIESVGGQNVVRSLAQGPRRGGERAILLFRRGVGQLARCGASLDPDHAHGGGNVGFGLDDLDGGHRTAPGPVRFSRWPMRPLFSPTRFLFMLLAGTPCRIAGWSPGERRQ